MSDLCRLCKIEKVIKIKNKGCFYGNWMGQNDDSVGKFCKNGKCYMCLFCESCWIDENKWEDLKKIKNLKSRGKEWEYIWTTYSPKSDDVQELLKILKKFLGGSNISLGVAQVEWGNWDNINDPKNLHFHAIIRLKDNNRWHNLTRNRKLPAWKFVKLQKYNEKYECDNLDYYKKYMTGEIMNEHDFDKKNPKKELDKLYRKKLNIEELITYNE